MVIFICHVIELTIFIIYWGKIKLQLNITSKQSKVTKALLIFQYRLTITNVPFDTR